ncbi:metal-dependent phosphohydrolase [Pedobacter metabolipauper]|uniref:HD domain-containing protein n=1 Tax=Pedobacter metabolipauper TaxID=425513 RepID=A0A4R6STC2_9SPHI|nr:metal-dependent phosphohydrolase [Pedobacter metabolipauper]TDQ08258.1 hypothetical protein ATK78_2766 [Pedobacter metabolipauper]
MKNTKYTLNLVEQHTVTDNPVKISKQKQLFEWVTWKHAGQLIKQTNEPYTNHLIAVAKLAGPFVELGYEIGLCHDLLEDTDTTDTGLKEALLNIGYTDAEAGLITRGVVELTDVYTKTSYPDLSKKERKERESKRLLSISPAAQTVKYADLIYNINWVLKYDRKDAYRYLEKKQRLLADLTRGNDTLRQQALKAIFLGLKIAVNKS